VRKAGDRTDAGLHVTRRKRVTATTAFLIHLTTQERALLLQHIVPPNALDHLLRRAANVGPLISVHLSLDELDEFMQYLEATANFAQNVQAQDRLGQLLTRIESGLSGDVDQGAHMTRPAATRLGYTQLQGQYLAFIYYYTKIHGRSPAEADLQTYFRVSPPSVHDMVRTLQRRRFIARTARVARSIRLLLSPEQIPDLE
jgi:DNA-binding MarR family transcriptional regulator